MFAPELATMRTVDVPQFCSWSACRIKNWFRAWATSGSGRDMSVGHRKHHVQEVFDVRRSRDAGTS